MTLRRLPALAALLSAGLAALVGASLDSPRLAHACAFFAPKLPESARRPSVVRAKLVIAPDGKVRSSVDGGSDLPDSRTVACCLRVLGRAEFPKPDHGEVKVDYALELTRGT
jgi:hypothetical protein